MINRIITLGLMFFAMTVQAQEVTNYLKTDTVIRFDNKDYTLQSSNVTKNHYKQEYVTKQEKLDNFTSLITVDFFLGDGEVNTLLQTTTQRLEQLKKTNPFVNYAVYGDESKRSFLFDSIVSDTSRLDTMRIVERTVSHYIQKKNGLMIVSVSKRAYGSNIPVFLQKLNATRPTLIKKVGEMTLPDVQSIAIEPKQSYYKLPW